MTNRNVGGHAKSLNRTRASSKHRLLGVALAFCVPTLPCTAVHAAEAIAAKVTYTGTYGDGRLYVGLDTVINEPGCSLPRFDVPPTHPNIKSLMATALAAAVTGQTIVIRAIGCFSGYPTVDETNGSYFYIQRQ